MDQDNLYPLPDMDFQFRTLPANVLGRDLVIGDLHGELSTLWRLLDEVKFDSAADRVISVGDLCDHGPDSPAALALLDEPWFYSVLGNHEVMLIARANRAREAYLQGQHRIENFLDTARRDCHGHGASWQLDWLEHAAKSVPHTYLELKLRALPLALQVESNKRVDTIVHAELPEELRNAAYTHGAVSSIRPNDAVIKRALSGRCAAWSARDAGEPCLGEVALEGGQRLEGLTICGHTPMHCAVKNRDHLFIDTGNGRRDVQFPRLSAFILQERRIVSKFHDS